jgi:hypothetical protein
VTNKELEEISRKMREEGDRIRREQKPMTYEQKYSQTQRNHGLWPLARDMTPEEVEAHLGVMKPIWDISCHQPRIPHRLVDNWMTESALEKLAQSPLLAEFYKPR